MIIPCINFSCVTIGELPLILSHLSAAVQCRAKISYNESVDNDGYKILFVGQQGVSMSRHFPSLDIEQLTLAYEKNAEYAKAPDTPMGPLRVSSRNPRYFATPHRVSAPVGDRHLL
jgi:hypothetical protein